MKILFTGGGTAGHIFPIVAIIREMKRIHPQNDLEIFYFGPKDGFSPVFLTNEGIKVKTIMSGKIRRYWTLKSALLNIFDIFIENI